ncbi:hypothetical protein H6504_03535 [Candidatus Woesearchaeota archaeon]|nr:hypothetical protein [Candidatus Woesearchaeota archaeon]
MVVSDFDTSTVEAELFFYQTVYAKKGISYYDSVIDKVYPGKIDLARVKDKSTIEAELLQTFDYGGAEPRLAAKYILEDASGKELATWYYDEDMYDNLIAVAFGTGAGAAIEVTHSLYVIIIDEGKKRSGVLKASIVKQNS